MLNEIMCLSDKQDNVLMGLFNFSSRYLIGEPSWSCPELPEVAPAI